WGEPYNPGKLIVRLPAGFSVPVLFLANLADGEFWKRHCFAAGEMTQLGEDRVLRVSFSPLPKIKEPEWKGTVLLDSASSMLRRIEYELVNLDKRQPITRLEGYTTFSSPT